MGAPALVVYDLDRSAGFLGLLETNLLLDLLLRRFFLLADLKSGQLRLSMLLVLKERAKAGRAGLRQCSQFCTHRILHKSWFLVLERTIIFLLESHGFAIIGQLRLFEDFGWTWEAQAREALPPARVHLVVTFLVLGSIE